MVTHKEMRNWLRQEARRADTLREIEKQLGDENTLKQSIDSLKRKYDKGLEKYDKIQKEAEATSDAARDILNAAEEEKRRILEDAHKIRESAKVFASRKNEIMAAAKKEASELRDLADEEAQKVVRGQKGKLADVKAEIADAERQRDAVLHEIDVLVKRRMAAESELEALRKKLG
jgi:chromosome segregation ATPase